MKYLFSTVSQATFYLVKLKDNGKQTWYLLLQSNGEIGHSLNTHTQVQNCNYNKCKRER